MKKILAAATLITAIFTGCLKDDTINVVGLPNTGTVVEIIPFTNGASYFGGGIENFSKSAVITGGQTAPITLFFVVNIAATGGTPLNKDLTVTVAYDDAARTTYNAQGGDQYVQMPDSCYSLPVKSGTIKAGKYLDTFYVTFYPTKIDPTKNYMAAITLKDAQGQTISGNFSTVYFHTIGNPLAGPYNVTGTRYNYTGVVSWNNVLPVPAGYTATTNMALYSPRSAAPDNTVTVEIPFGNVGTGYNYVITLTGTNSISVDYTFDALYSNIVTSLATYNATTKTIHIITHYNNALGAAGNDRIFDETFVHQ